MKQYIVLLALFVSFSFYGQNDTLSVIRHTENDMVYPKELKVVYRGIQNQLSIKVPDKQFTATAPGLEKISEGLYTLVPGSGTELTITIVYKKRNGKAISEKHLYQIKNMGGFVSTIKNRDADKPIRMQKQQLKNAIVSKRFVDKNLILPYDVASFNIKIPGKAPLLVIGNTINDEAYKQILTASLGDMILISDIKFNHDEKVMAGSCFLSGPIVIELY